MIVPALELILGFLLYQNRQIKVENYLPLPSYKFVGVSGPNDAWYDKAERDDDGESLVIVGLCVSGYH